MASITSAGIGSGLDVESIISGLMSIERSKLNRLESRVRAYDADISAYGKVKSAVSSFKSTMNGLKYASDFEVYKAKSADEDVFTVTADDSASKGSYDILVTQLAEAHKLKTSTGFASTDTFSTGTLDITAGGGSFSVDITSSDNTLEGIRDAINNASDNSGVTASIINDGSGNQYLTLTADDTGTANAISVSVSGEDTGAGTYAMSSYLTYDAGTDTGTLIQQQEDLNATLSIDGVGITSSSNTVEDAISGVTLELQGLTASSDPADSVALTVGLDIESVKSSVDDFVKAYNNVISTISNYRKEGGELEADSTLRSIENGLKSIINTEATGLTGDYSYLAEIGLTHDDNGKLVVDSAELTSALESDFEGVSELFTNDDQGYAFRFAEYATDVAAFDGILESRIDGYESSQDRWESQIDRELYRLDLIEERYRAQYTQLDMLVAQFQSTGSYLSGQLGIY